MVKCYVKDYPRPQFVRENWQNLNGTWGFRFDDANKGESEKWNLKFESNQQIQVPFTYETKLSGIQDESSHNYVWYHRGLTVDGDRLPENRLILHFEGVDFFAKVWVNGKFAGSHRGGYARFSVDITDLVHDGENDLTVKVEDTFDMQQPRGKQRWIPENYGCWYVQTTGIWKTVWYEYVPNSFIANVKMTPNMEQLLLDLEFEISTDSRELDGSLAIETIISYNGKLINRLVNTVMDRHVHVAASIKEQYAERFSWTIHKWAPNSPNLYDIEFRLVENGCVVDRVGSYFAMREIAIHGPSIMLNGRELYQRLILDQGYWKESHLTPPSEEALIEDIDKILSLGYNGLRKHQKTEDERFLFWCDVKGVLVWCEMPSAYRFSDYAVSEFTEEWLEVVKQNYNHPCIITWTPFNESWGIEEIRTSRPQQHYTEAIYHITKTIDPFRPVIVNDGWEHTVSDILTLHDYEAAGSVLKERYTSRKDDVLSGAIAHNKKYYAFANGYHYAGQPVIISEFGGIAFADDGAGWGYGDKVAGKDAFVMRFDEITTAVKQIPYVCGYCYTQVTDVQQEINGLLDIDRNYKIDPEIIKAINEK